MTLMMSGMAMASYACPDLLAKPASMQMPDGEPCAGMDLERPVHCAEFSADTEASVDQHKPDAALSPLAAASLIRVLAPVSVLAIDLTWSGVPPEPGADPPYLRTLRLRI